MSVSNANNSNKIGNSSIPVEGHGYHFDQPQKYHKQVVNRELKNHPIKDSVAIVWHSKNNGMIAHASLSVDDKLYGFALGTPTEEPASLRASCARRMGKLNKKVIVQYVAVNSYQRKLIEAICQKSFFFSSTCMDAISQILSIAKVIDIPFPINQTSVMAANYLDNLYAVKRLSKVAQLESKETRIGDLFKQTTYGFTKPFIKEEYIEFALEVLFSYAFPYIVVNSITMNAFPDLAHHIGIGCVALVALKHLAIIKAQKKALFSASTQ